MMNDGYVVLCVSMRGRRPSSSAVGTSNLKGKQYTFRIIKLLYGTGNRNW